MNKKLLLEYINREMESGTGKNPGPVVTISREFGCPGNTLANTLLEAVKGYRSVDAKNHDWDVVDKKAINIVSNELKIPAATIERVLKEKNSGTFGDMFSAFSDHYIPGDMIIKKKYVAIISSLAINGNVIIVGRGGDILTQNIKRSLHIKLTATKKWRTEQIMESQKLDKKKAKKLLESVDRERVYLRKFYSGGDTKTIYSDIIFNTEKTSVEEMTKGIIAVMLERKLILK